jgi:hypothetical protein
MQYLRGIGGFFLTVLGLAVFLLSFPAAFGWGHKVTSIGGTVVAIGGLSAIFAAYWLVRDMDGAPILALCLKIALGLGSTLLVVALCELAMSLQNFPAGYFLVTGCFSLIAFIRFRKFTKSD